MCDFLSIRRSRLICSVFVAWLLATALPAFAQITVTASLPGTSTAAAAPPTLATSDSFNLNGGNAVVLLVTSEGDSSIAATFAGQAMTLGVSINQGAQWAGIFYLINPASGSGSFVINGAVTSTVAYSALALDDVAQVAGSAKAANALTSGTVNLPFTTASNGGFVLSAAVNNGFNSGSPAPSVSESNKANSVLYGPAIVGSSGHLHVYGGVSVAGTYSEVYTNRVNSGAQRNAYVTLAFDGFNASTNNPPSTAPRQMENIGRGLVALNRGSGNVYVSWRLLGLDPAGIGFNVYRATGGAAATKVNATPITNTSCYNDTGVNIAQTNVYFVKPVINGQEQGASSAFTLPAAAPSAFWLTVPTELPPGGTTPDGTNYTYRANDCSIGDVDGDGEYEIILKWDPSNSKDNANSGYTGNVLLDCYKLDGTRLWRIDLGINIRAGSHYTQFMVYDLDGDGKAEIACKTAPGTKDASGANVILGSDDPNADYRNGSGYILSGPEYLTIFAGDTGQNLWTTNYVPARGNVSDWGDSYGNRVDRFLACVAYLDGQRPSLVMCRGYYTRTALAAWDWRDGQLTQRWVFDTGHSGGPWSAWKGQGNHNLSVGDVDADGRDEIIYGACSIDDNGSGLYSTELGHGDALHVSDMDPSRPGLEVWMPHENAPYGASFRDAKTGEIIFRHTAGGDTGRGTAAHIDPAYPGYQMWSSASGGTYNTAGILISSNVPNYNHLAWWDPDLQRETVDVADGNGVNPIIDKWNGNGESRLLNLYNYPSSYVISANNSTKGNPCLSGDILGDWREELIYRLKDGSALLIFFSNVASTNRFRTFLHDPQYRLALAWQNVGYNQPPHPSFYVGAGMSSPPTPNIIYTVNPNPPVLLANHAGNALTLSWPDHRGWTLQMQTNSLSSGLGTNWMDVPGSTSMTSTNITVDAAKPTVFYRMKL